jgi:hypothetical protein
MVPYDKERSSRIFAAVQALRPPTPAKEYVLPEWDEFVKGKHRGRDNNVATEVGWIVSPHVYNAIREATAREPQPVKTIPVEVSNEDVDVCWDVYVAHNMRAALTMLLKRKGL